MVLVFSDGGALATGAERTYSYSPSCGYGAAVSFWSAKWTGAPSKAFVRSPGLEERVFPEPLPRVQWAP